MGILHFPRVLPLSLHGRTFCLHIDSMVVYFVKDGSFHSPPLDVGFDFVLSSTEQFLCSCPHPRQAECGCRSGFPVRVPLPPSGCWSLGPLNPFAKNFQFSRQWPSFCLRATSRLSCFVFPCPDPQSFFIRMPGIPFLD